MRRWMSMPVAFGFTAALGCAVGATDFEDVEQASSCTPGETVACACADGTESVQICAEEGDAFLPCGCVGVAAGGVAGIGSPTTGDPPSGAGSGGAVGTPTGTGGVPLGVSGAPAVAGGNGSTGGVQNTGGFLPAGGAADVGSGGAPPPPPPPGSSEPIIPAVTGDCPAFVNSSVTFMGLGGIEIVAGAKPLGPTAPMVFYWHGTGGSSGEYGFQATAVRDGVVAEGGVLISFQGTSGGDLLSGTLIFGAPDFNIADQLVACAVRDHNVDPRQIFATGCSAGGLFSTAMGALRSNYMAAVAPNSGGLLAPSQFQNDHTPALMTIHGAPGVDVVVVDFSQTSATADQTYAARGGFVINCNHNGSHCGGGGFAGDIWTFFKAHPYGVDPEPWLGGLPPGFNPVCQIY